MGRPVATPRAGCNLHDAGLAAFPIAVNESRDARPVPQLPRLSARKARHCRGVAGPARFPFAWLGRQGARNHQFAAADDTVRTVALAPRR